MYAFFVVFTLIISIVLLAALKWREEDGKGRVAVIVLGDLGRSPRMQYHALSLCREGYDVEFVGYGGTKCIRVLSELLRWYTIIDNQWYHVFRNHGYSAYVLEWV